MYTLYMKEAVAFCKVLKSIFIPDVWELTLEKKEKGSGASVGVDARYMRMDVKIGGDFFDNTRKWQAEALIHEFCHLFNVPVDNLVDNLRDGHWVTKEHQEDVIEHCNVRAEKVIIKLLTDKTLKKAYDKYISAGRNIKRPKASGGTRKQSRTIQEIS